MGWIYIDKSVVEQLPIEMGTFILLAFKSKENDILYRELQYTKQEFNRTVSLYSDDGFELYAYGTIPPVDIHHDSSKEITAVWKDFSESIEHEVDYSVYATVKKKSGSISRRKLISKKTISDAVDARNRLEMIFSKFAEEITVFDLEFLEELDFYDSSLKRFFAELDKVHYTTFEEYLDIQVIFNVFCRKSDGKFASCKEN